MTNIIVDSPVDGQELEVPFTLSGTATAIAPATNVVAIEVQIDSAAQHDLGVVPAPSIPFGYTVTEADCPAVDTWYLLTIYAWDDQGNLDIKTISIKRVDLDLVDDEIVGLP